MEMSGKLSVTLPGSSTNKLSVASSSGRKRCSLACGTEKRGSVGGRSGSEDSVYEYEGPEFIIHKEDFLIHNKKVRVHSHSILLHFLSYFIPEHLCPPARSCHPCPRCTRPALHSWVR